MDLLKKNTIYDLKKNLFSIGDFVFRARLIVEYVQIMYKYDTWMYKLIIIIEIKWPNASVLCIKTWFNRYLFV